MNMTEIFKPNGDGYDIAPAGVLLIIAGELYGEDELSKSGRTKCKLILDSFINAAIKGGYKQSDILLTLLSRNDKSRRVVQMALDACNAAGNNALNEIIDKLQNRH